MVKSFFYREIYLIPLICGILIQIIKVIVYSIVNRRFAVDKLIQADGFPNLHSAGFSSFFAAIGIQYGVSSLLFSVVTVYGIIIIHDTMRLKGEKEKQTDALRRIISSVDEYSDLASEKALRALSFRPLDVLSGAALGIVGARVLL